MRAVLSSWLMADPSAPQLSPTEDFEERQEARWAAWCTGLRVLDTLAAEGMSMTRSILLAEIRRRHHDVAGNLLQKNRAELIRDGLLDNDCPVAVVPRPQRPPSRHRQGGRNKTGRVGRPVGGVCRGGMVATAELPGDDGNAGTRPLYAECNISL